MSLKINGNINLRPATIADLETLFEFQLNDEGRYLAAFTSKETLEKSAYIKKYSTHLDDPTNNTQTILLDNMIVGSIAKFIMFGDAEITYWTGRAYWGKGVASTALKQFLEIEATRPLHGRVAFDNIGSQRVLEKAGFVRVGKDKGFANERGAEIEEYIFRLGQESLRFEV